MPRKESHYGHDREGWYAPKWPQVSPNDRQGHEAHTPPQPAPDCGHYCQRFGHRFDSTQFVGMVENPRLPGYSGATPADINQIEFSFDATLVPKYQTVQQCCRCRMANQWFGTAGGPNPYQLWSYDGHAVYQSPGTGHSYHDRTQVVLSQGRSEEFTAIWLKRKGEVPTVDATHIGWHAGLRRPTFRDGSYSASTRQGLDAYGVCSGPVASRSLLCHCCRSILPTIPAHLFWVARGWSVAQAQAVSAWELKCWTPGKSEDRINLGVLDILAHLPW